MKSRPLKELVKPPASAVEAFLSLLRQRFPDLKAKILPLTYADEDIAVDLFVPEEIAEEVDIAATEISHQIEEETGFFVLHFIRLLSRKKIERDD